MAATLSPLARPPLCYSYCELPARHAHAPRLSPSRPPPAPQPARRRHEFQTSCTNLPHDKYESLDRAASAKYKVESLDRNWSKFESLDRNRKKPEPLEREKKFDALDRNRKKPEPQEREKKFDPTERDRKSFESLDRNRKKLEEKKYEVSERDRKNFESLDRCRKKPEPLERQKKFDAFDTKHFEPIERDRKSFESSDRNRKKQELPEKEKRYDPLERERRSFESLDRNRILVREPFERERNFDPLQRTRNSFESLDRDREKFESLDRDRKKSEPFEREKKFDGSERDRKKFELAEREKKFDGLERDRKKFESAEREKKFDGLERDRKKFESVHADRKKPEPLEREKFDGSERDRRKFDGLERDRKKFESIEREKKFDGLERDRKKFESLDRDRKKPEPLEREKFDGLERDRKKFDGLERDRKKFECAERERKSPEKRDERERWRPETLASPGEIPEAGIHDPAGEQDVGSAVASSVRRLRNSIFSSLKLPRKVSKMASPSQAPLGGTLGRGERGGAQAKRKSAVELLAESKAFYVKSEIVLDRKQELPLRMCTPVNSSTGAHYATLSGRRGRIGAGAGGEALQSQLRRLLASSSVQSPNTPHDSRSQSIHQSPSQNIYHTEKRKTKEGYEWDANSHPSPATRSHYNSGTFSGNSSSGTSGSKGQVKSDPEHSRASNSGAYNTKSLNRPSSSGDNRIFFPDSFVLPKPSRSDPANVFSNSFSIGSPFSSPEKIDARKILSVVDAYDSDYGILDSKVDYYDTDFAEDFSTISPPAEYAITERSNYRYVRSNSHSHTIKPQDGSNVNINSHKSLPDLHKQAEQYTEDGRRVSGASMGSVGPFPTDARPSEPARSNEALSSYSKATSGRSNRSSVFSSKGSSHSRRSASCHTSDPSAHTPRDDPYYYRSGSSYARDSGGSSGHCSGPVPSPRPPQRRDSGSSTQHSSSRSHRYSGYYDSYAEGAADALEFHVSAPLQFQDGAPQQLVPVNNNRSPPQVSQGMSMNATVSICASFNNNRTPPSDRAALVGIHFQASIPPLQFQDHFMGRRESGTRESRHIMQRPNSSGYTQGPRYEAEEGSPPGNLGNFKRQRCLRYKQRRPILRSKSDMSDRYWRGDTRVDARPLELRAEKARITPPPSPHPQLQRFFEQLGMDDQDWRDTVLGAPASPPASPGTADSPARSDSSRADSTLMQGNGDYTVTGMQPKEKLYRSCEPPSIVERNARIIKWLCNCRKLQAI